MKHILYECEICGAFHAWSFAGDCRDDSSRFSDASEYAEKMKVNESDVEVRSMDERVAADEAETIEPDDDISEFPSEAEPWLN